jgi:RNA polymerase sigma factor for flagellar operon FliA
MDWCPRRVRARAKKLKEAIGNLEQRIGRAATEKEICEELVMSPSDYAKWLEESKPVTFIAIDQEYESDSGSSGSSLHDLLSDETDVTGRENLEKGELLQLLVERIDALPEIPKKILSMYYYEKMRLAEIAEVFSLTESRICQIHSQTILGLRAYLDRARNA